MIYERLIWLVPLAVAALGAWRPRAGLLVLTASLPFFGSPPGGPYLAALDVAAIAAILTAWRGGRPERSPLTWPVAAFVAVSLVSLVPSPYQPPSWRPAVVFELLAALPGVETWSALYTWRAAADLLLGWGLFLAVRRAFAGESMLPLARALLGGLAAVLVLGVLSAGQVVDLGGFRPKPASERLHSVFFLSGWLSEYIVLATPPALAALKPLRPRVAQLALPALALFCLSLTLQRGAWVAAGAQLAFVAGVAVARWRWRPEKIRAAVLKVSVAGVLTAGLFFATGSPLVPTLERAREIETGISPRSVLWSAAVDMTRERPLLGWGLGSFAPAYDRVFPPGTPEASPWRNTAHSLYLDVAAERGVLGLLALALVASCLALCLARPREGSERMAVALAAVLVGAAVYGLVQYLFHLRNIAWLLWLLLAAAAGVSRRRRLPALERVAQGICCAAVLLVPLRLALSEAPPYAGDRSYGLHEIELDAAGPFRWTEGSAAMAIPRDGNTLILELANGHPRAGERPVTVEIGIDGESRLRMGLEGGGWQTLALTLEPQASEPPSGGGRPPAAAGRRRDEVLLTLEVHPTFRPFSEFRRYPELEPSLDIRLLGAALRGPRWE